MNFPTFVSVDKCIYRYFGGLSKGFYPHVSELCHTLSPTKYPIPNSYSVKTSWDAEKVNKQFDVKLNGKPEFQILFGIFFENEIKSNMSYTKAATGSEMIIKNEILF
ncbi:6088_t:CDS:2 [Funneliformis caledonium]|uniref:6088_t:CDS:1 n=1 Tax=Funneliformis caledonium TaxID=1117310 RepID=A0A9N9B8R4_9GLOM|nr:6088_t:CDS:2 [Funneliformis caledonium]